MCGERGGSIVESFSAFWSDQDPGPWLRMAANNTRLANTPSFLRQFKLSAVFLSVLLVAPCVWHRRIEAGDLASHVYNAWLAQLIEKGQAPGLYLSNQWNNVLFDVALLRTAKLVGFPAAQGITVSVCVLIFFWGVFAFVGTITERPPWFLTPCVAMLAHPIGFLWLLGTLAYVWIRAKLPGWWKLALPLVAASGFFAVYWYVSHRPALLADWDRGPFYLYNGADQLGLYGKRYIPLAWAAFLFGLVCVAVDFYSRRRDNASWKRFELPLEPYLVTFCATALLPENLRPSIYGGWIGLLGSRLTSISAIFGLCVLGLLKPRRWHAVGFGACAIVFFAFLYQDTGWLNRLEAKAEKLVSDLPPGTRVMATVWAPPGSRITFIGHAIERACIGHCFSYANYEPASGEFRVRVKKGSPVATSSTDDAEDMASGEYEVGDDDLPMKQIYQCDAGDLTKLCIRDLEAGEVNGRIGYKPGAP